MALTLGTNLPGDWSYFGCWTDTGRRKLSGPNFASGNGMTQQSCIAYCQNVDYPYAGIEYAGECFCGLTIGAGSEKRPDGECNMGCSGATSQACGGGNRLTIFYSPSLNYTKTNPGPPNTSRIGCVTDQRIARVLPVSTASDNMTVKTCTDSCRASGYSIAGLEYGRECFCGNSLASTASITDEGCDLRCVGNDREFCGGTERLDAYTLNAITTPTTPPADLPLEITDQTLPNGGFEGGLNGWQYFPDDEAVDVVTSNQAFSGSLAASITPRSASTAADRYASLYTLVTGLDPTREWYRVSLAIGRPSAFPLNNVSPFFSIASYNEAMYGAKQTIGLCGTTNSPVFSSYGSCDYNGKNGAVYQKYGINSRLFQGPTNTANLTQLGIQIQIVWPAGSPSVPVLVDDMRVYQMKKSFVSG